MCCCGRTRRISWPVPGNLQIPGSPVWMCALQYVSPSSPNVLAHSRFLLTTAPHQKWSEILNISDVSSSLVEKIRTLQWVRRHAMVSVIRKHNTLHERRKCEWQCCLPVKNNTVYQFRGTLPADAALLFIKPSLCYNWQVINASCVVLIPCGIS